MIWRRLCERKQQGAVSWLSSLWGTPGGACSSPELTRQAAPQWHSPVLQARPHCVTCWHTQSEPSCSLTAASAPLSRVSATPAPWLNGAAPPGMDLAASSLPFPPSREGSCHSYLGWTKAMPCSALLLQVPQACIPVGVCALRAANFCMMSHASLA